MIRICNLRGYENLRDYYYLKDKLMIVSCNNGEVELKSRLNSSGYVSYPLITKDGKQSTVLLHRVIAIALIDNLNGYNEVNHIDENKLNNSIENLEWCTHMYNCNYGTRIKRYSEKRMKPVKQYDTDGKLITIHSSVIAATKRMGLNSKSAITNCIAGRSKTCLGYRWKYV